MDGDLWSFHAPGVDGELRRGIGGVDATLVDSRRKKQARYVLDDAV